MRPATLRRRVICALELQPMTAAQVAKCLSTTPQNAMHVLRDIESVGVAIKSPVLRSSKRYAAQFELVNGGGA